MTIEAFDARVRKYLSDSLAATADGVTLGEVGRFFQGLLLLAVDAAFGLDDDGAVKKQWVMDQLLKLFDEVLPVVPLPLWLAWVKLPIVSGAARKLFAYWLSGAIESAYEWIKQTRAAHAALINPVPINLEVARP